MRVLLINTYFNGGGAEKVLRQLYYGLPNLGVETKCLVGRYQNNLPEEVEVIYKTFWGRALTTLVGSVFRNTLFWTPISRRKIVKYIKDNNIDLVHFHNIHSNYLGLFEISKISKVCPNIIITMHDMWTFTGGCAHASNCKGFLDGCMACKGNMTMLPFKFARICYNSKRALLDNGILWVSPSKWLKSLAEKSFLADERLETLWNGINTEVYRPYDPEELRRKYGISKDKHILLFAANGINNVFKGYHYVSKALDMVNNPDDYVAIVVGNREKTELNLNISTIDLGYVDSEEKMAELYSLADLFLLPSVADTLPFTPMEAMACGTPVLAFSVGGIPEIVNAENGWICDKIDAKSFAEYIDYIFDINNIEEYNNKALKCREHIVSNFNEEVMISNYAREYYSMME